MTAADIDIGLIGRHFFGPDLRVERQLHLDTPWGTTSSPVRIADVDGARVGLIHRHGDDNELLPHQVPYAANVSALKQLGAGDLVGFTVVGSLSRDVRRGDFLLCDQYVDFTWGRQWTVFDGDQGAHADMAEPFCARLRGEAIALLGNSRETVHHHATTAVINGPKFQTKAESRYYAQVGASVINMTQSTEAALAREMEMCHLNISMCTDYGVLGDDLGDTDQDDRAVASDDVTGYLASNSGRVERVVRTVLPRLSSDPGCSCRAALEGMRTHGSEAQSGRHGS